MNQNYFRDYDSSTGRYVESDPLGLYGASLSTYAYVKGNPLRYTDPFGLGPWDKRYGLPKDFWKWFHRQEGGDLIKELKDATGQVPKETAKEYYKYYKQEKNIGSVSLDFLYTLLAPFAVQLALYPSELGCGTLDCHPEYQPKPQPKTCP